MKILGVHGRSVAPAETSRLRRSGFRALAVGLSCAISILASAAGAAGIANVTDEALFNAVRDGSLDRVKAAIAQGARLTAENGDGATPIEYAISLGRREIAKYLFSLPGNPNPLREDRRQAAPDPFNPSNPVPDILQASAPPPFTPSLLSDKPAEEKPAAETVAAKPPAEEPVTEVPPTGAAPASAAPVINAPPPTPSVSTAAQRADMADRM